MVSPCSLAGVASPPDAVVIMLDFYRRGWLRRAEETIEIKNTQFEGRYNRANDDVADRDAE